MRPEIEKTKLAAGVLPDESIKNLLDQISGSVIELNGCVGVYAEYLSSKGNDVVLTDPNRLSNSYRRTIVPDSKVKFWNIEVEDIKLSKPTFDYVIIHDLVHYGIAKKLAKMGIVNLPNKNIEFINNVINTSEITVQNTEVDGNSGTDKVD